jgi:hypothetical protein
MIGIMCFLILVVLANILKYHISNPVYLAGVEFLNSNFWLLVLIAVLLFIGDIFRVFPFPLNLPSPIIRAVGSVFCLAFILGVFGWIDQISGTSIYPVFWFLSFLIIPLVFIIVLVAGYVEILWQFFRQQKSCQKEQVHIVGEGIPDPEPAPESEKSWDEIYVELRMMIYDMIHRFREEIKK